MIIDTNAAKALALELIKELEIINPILFKDMTENRRSKFVNRLSLLIPAWVELKVVQAISGRDSDEFEAQEDAVNALTVATLSQLGIAKEEMAKNLKVAFAKLGQKFAGALVGALVKGAT